MSLLERIGRQALFAFDPETAHGLSIAALKTGLPLCPKPKPDARLKVRVAGLDFPNPLGMAAGYDKNAEVPDALLALGFGFAEVGTVTPLPQPGNPKPRIFRLTADQAVINRLGDQPEKRFEAGQAWSETPLQPHYIVNASRTEPAQLVVVQIARAGTTAMTEPMPVKEPAR